MRFFTALFLLPFLLFSSPVDASLACSSIIESSPAAFANHNSALNKKVILQSSISLSRTLNGGRKFLAPEELSKKNVQTIALENFHKAVDFVLANSLSLDLSAATAIKLNSILTRGLVPDSVIGDFNHRLNSNDSTKVDTFLGSDSPQSFYDWLVSPRAQKMNAVKLAEIIHHNIAAYDSFPDGNGRLSRLMADLALIRAGYKPVLYNNRDDYFDRGNARAESTREEKKEYFFQMFSAGQNFN